MGALAKARPVVSEAARSVAPINSPLPAPAFDLLISFFCAAKLLLHAFTSLRRCGYFRDELYYPDLSRHFDWGYIDCAPLIAVYTKIFNTGSAPPVQKHQIPYISIRKKQL
jgi:hypothetical protein